MTDVFISYSRADKPFAQSLADDLVANDLNVWWDFEIDAGQSFSNAIQDALHSASAVIVVWSATAVKSAWVLAEATFAAKHTKLITTHVPAFNVDAIPREFAHRHTVVVTDRKLVYRALRSLGFEVAGLSAVIPEYHSPRFDPPPFKRAFPEAKPYSSLPSKDYFLATASALHQHLGQRHSALSKLNLAQVTLLRIFDDDDANARVTRKVAQVQLRELRGALSEDSHAQQVVREMEAALTDLSLG